MDIICYNKRIMIYFDNASTTKISEQSLASYIEASELFFNPSSLYKQSVTVKNMIESARSSILKFLKGVIGSTLIFTGSATEANNAVLNSSIIRKDKKYIISAGEHSSIYATAKKYLEAGYNIEFAPLNKNGSVNMYRLKDMIDKDTAFISIIHVSNETGAVNDIKEICRYAKNINPNIIVHSDGVQALGKINVDLKSLGVDYYTISAHKIHGPKGIGALYIANKNKFKPFIYGGEQEMGLRAGTENTSNILAMKTAIDGLSIIDYHERKHAIKENLSGDYILVSDDTCVDNIISVCFKGVRGETIEHMLESCGYLVGTGSACNSKAGYNRVLSNIVPKEYLAGAIRISFGEEVTKEDCKNLAISLSNAVKQYNKRIN